MTSGEEDLSPDRRYESGVPRRGFIAGALSLGAGAVLAGCGAKGSTAQTKSASLTTGKPVKGGHLRVAHVGNGTSETFNPNLFATSIDAARGWQVYDPLNWVNADWSLSPGLAIGWDHNASNTIWELKLRPDVTFHNGKKLTVDDVIFTWHQNAKPGAGGATAVQNVRLGELKKINDLTLRIPLYAADGNLPSNFVLQQNLIIQNGETDFKHPVGTGPFKFHEFVPGQHSLLLANQDYWETGRPYVDSVEDISIPNDSARLNALLSNQVDAVDSLAYTLARQQQSAGQINVLSTPSPNWNVFLMRVDVAPFNDVRVRQAMRLLADRPALIEGALSGFGTPSNDLFGKGVPYFASQLPVRQQDPEQAKSLLKAAGHSGMTVTLQTSPIYPGFVEAATLFAQQAKAGGVNVVVKTDPVSSYFNPSLLYLKMPLAQSLWQAVSLATFYGPAMLKNAPYDETHWKSAEFDRQCAAAIATSDHAEATERWLIPQKVQYDQGGYIGWANTNWVDGLSKRLRGVVGNPFWNLGCFDYRNWWFAEKA
jgi:peptide/nickel transport system substrate-binding protein